MVKYHNGDLIEYAILDLVDYYDNVMKKPTEVWDFTKRSAKEAEFIAFSLVETMSKFGGLGISANQCGYSDRVCAVNAGKEAWIMFNPVIIEKSETLSTFSEGCLSYPGLYLKIPRSDHLKVRFQAIGGQFVEQEVDGLTAVCIQHELDHLDGIRFTDLVSPIKLEKAKRKVKKTLKSMQSITVDDFEKIINKKVI